MKQKHLKAKNIDHGKTLYDLLLFLGLLWYLKL
jgi:hypothetical protein